ncbi:MAG: MBL fold metallo-hydrolase [Rikenellaceae bacterium]|nr:MBL fold metallo-hydrolase [Rikenellaceae bacterium]
MIDIALFCVNPFQENTYVVADKATGRCIIIDAGCSNERETSAVIDYIRSNRLEAEMIVGTHGHIDHIMGVQTLKEELGIPYALSSDDRFLVESAAQQAAMFGLKVPVTPSIDIDLKERDEITFGQTVLKVIPTPGHTPGHVCLFHEEGRMLFTGDTLFRESIGRTDLPGGDYSWIMRSILDRIVPLGDDVVFHAGHGPSSDIGHEVLYNPFVVEVMNNEINYRG